MPGMVIPEQNHIFGRIAACRTRARISRTSNSSRCPSVRFCTKRAMRLRHIYFPTDAIVSLLYVLENRVVGGDLRGRQRRRDWGFRWFMGR